MTSDPVPAALDLKPPAPMATGWRRAVWNNHAWLRDVFSGVPRAVA